MTTQNTNENLLSVGAKWSVDFVEHLRTVHFALTSLAVALLILISASIDERIEKALTQADLILEKTESWEHIRDNLYARSMFEMKTWDPPTGLILDVISPEPGVDDDPHALTYIVPEAKVLQWQPWHYGIDMASAPVTLADFAKWWDDIYRKKILVQVVDPEPPIDCSDKTTTERWNSKEPDVKYVRCVALEESHEAIEPLEYRFAEIFSPKNYYASFAQFR